MHRVYLFTRPGCSSCTSAKQWLERHDLQFMEFDIDADHRHLEFLIARAGRTSVPRVFFGDEHVGDYDDLIRLERMHGFLLAARQRM